MQRFDLMPETEFTVPLLMTIQQMDTSLVTIVLDVSGSFEGQIGRGALQSISDAVSITGEGNVNIIQFSDRISHVTGCKIADLQDTIDDLEWVFGGGGNFQPVLDALAGRPVEHVGPKADLSKLTLRTGALANTPIILVSDGWLHDLKVNLNDRFLHPSKFEAPFDNTFVYLRYGWTND